MLQEEWRPHSTFPPTPSSTSQYREEYSRHASPMTRDIQTPVPTPSSDAPILHRQDIRNKNLRLFAASLLALREPLVLALSNEIDMDKERVLGGKRRLT